MPMEVPPIGCAGNGTTDTQVLTKVANTGRREKRDLRSGRMYSCIKTIYFEGLFACLAIYVE